MTGAVNDRGSLGVRAVAFSILLALAGCATPPSEVPGPASIRGLRPSGHVALTELFVSGSGVGGGTLTFRGRVYPFTLTGELIGLGAVTTLEAAGGVYNLEDPSQFSGAYIQGTRSLANSVSTTGDLWLENNNGVIMHLAARNAGLILSTGRFEVFIELTR
jgi:hypothetical protein